MLCKKPYRRGPQTYGCGQCTNCRINKTREWVGRMYLEACEHKYSAFVTLTYNEEHLPKDGYLHKSHLQLFLKRLRKELYPRKIRYFACGEYGDVSWRPHFHAIIFGLSPTEGRRVEKCWINGFNVVGTAEPSSMRYVAGYLQKRLTNPQDQRLAGRTPEFASMSLKPGIGHGIVDRISKELSTQLEKDGLQMRSWKAEVRIGQKKYPIGRYLREKVYERMGVDKAAKSVILWENFEEAFLLNKGKTKSDLAQELKTKMDQQHEPITAGRNI